MTIYSLDDIKKIVDDFALKINVPSNLLPSYGQQTWDAHPYIEVNNLGFMFYIISERGQEYERKMTDKIDNLLYWIFANVTFSMASDYEQKNRIVDKDCRRIMFAKQEELLGQLNENWRFKENAEHQSILKRHPWDDLAGLRATYCGQLRKQGLTETEIYKLAYAKYPTN
jgi:Immunity protein 63